MPATKAARARSGIPRELLTRLVQLSDEPARVRLLQKHRNLLTTAVVTELTNQVPEQAKVDSRKALALAKAAMTIAKRIGDPESIAKSCRATANALHVLGQNQAALKNHDQAKRLFKALGNQTELARTLSASIQPLILLGKYKRAFAAAEQARRIFRAEGNHWRLARLELNAGNIFHRQDRFAEALDCYQRSYRYFLPHQAKDAEAVAVALHNIAMCLVSLNDFHQALATYQAALAFAREHRMPLLAGQADYNIACLFQLRGEYNRAIQLLRSTRETCRQNGDQYHFALCHLDLSDIYLELNLNREAAEMAQQACTQFQQLEMAYEAGKSLVNLAIAEHQQQRPGAALRLFVNARRMLVRETNQAWTFLIDLYRSMVLCEQGRYAEAKRLCLAAQRFFRTAKVPSKSILCDLLLARVSLLTGKLGPASSQCDAALQHLKRLELPALHCQAYCLLAEIQVRSGKPAAALECYKAAREVMETLRSNIQGEDLKISFLKNKLQIYEGLVELSLTSRPGSRGAESALEYIEEAKSRSLRDLVLRAGSAMPLPSTSTAELQAKVQSLRAELNWYSHLAQVEQLRADKSSAKHLAEIRSQALGRENELLALLREIPPTDVDPSGLVSPRAITLAEIRGSLGPEQTILEFFQIRDKLVAGVLSRDTLEIITTAKASRVEELVQALQFQFSKFRLEPGYVNTFGDFMLKSTQEHLEALYDELMRPLDGRLPGRHLVIVPHGILHCLPFHALYDGRQYLIDLFEISYAPSATIYSLCCSRSVNSEGPALVLGVPDQAAPLIDDEARRVASVLPASELFVGDAATAEVLRSKGVHGRLIHIATHGYFRQDNTMFSGIRLADSLLTLYDLYQMRLPVELITLSGCSTGLNVVAAGDELLGMVRGLIYAGAQTALLTLWDVQDRSTTEFMDSFYRRLSGAKNKASALQGAMQELRSRYPHPYYWAPFILVGK